MLLCMFYLFLLFVSEITSAICRDWHYVLFFSMFQLCSLRWPVIIKVLSYLIKSAATVCYFAFIAACALITVVSLTRIMSCLRLSFLHCCLHDMIVIQPVPKDCFGILGRSSSDSGNRAWCINLRVVRPAHVVQWSSHLGAMCSRAWRSQRPHARLPTKKELFQIIPMHMITREKSSL